MVCIWITHILCKLWKFFRTGTFLRKIDDFDYTIWDLRSEYANESEYQEFVGKLPFFMKDRSVDAVSETVVNNIKFGDMGLNYSFEHFIKKGDVPKQLLEPITGLIKRELLEQTVQSHKPSKPVVLINDKKQEKEHQVVKLKKGGKDKDARLRQ